MSTPSVLVYGTSVAALRAAATFSKQGYIVYLINSGRFLGDIPNILSYKKPRTICNTCLRFFLNRQPTMRIMNQAEVTNITGNAGEFTVKIRKRTPDVDEKKCIECGLCLGKKGVSVIERPMANNVYLIDRKKADITALLEVCPTGAINPEIKEEEIEVKVGTIIISPNVKLKSAEELADFGFGKNPDVVRISDVEQWFLGWGPNYEKFVKPSDGKPPLKVAYIIPQGLKNIPDNGGFGPFMHAVQSAVSVKELDKNIAISIFAKEIYAYGKGQMEYLRKAENNDIKIQLVDDLSVEGTKVGYLGNVFESDLIIISEPENPPDKNKYIKELLSIKLDENGYIVTSENNPIVVKEGIFAIGESIGHFGTMDAVNEGTAVGVNAEKYLGAPTYKKPQLPPIRKIEPYEPPKIGIYLCDCATKFGEFVDTEELKEKFLSASDIVSFEIVKFLCLKDGIEKIKEDINSGKVNRIVFAACSPWERGNFLQNQARMVGLPISLTEIAEIRDFGVLPHIASSKKEAIMDKVYHLINMAVQKVTRSMPYEPPLLDFTQRAIVIGNGYPALHTAYQIAKRGFPVDILSPTDNIKGVWKDIDGFSSKMDKLINEIKDNKNITLHIKTDILNIDGYAGNYNVRFKENEKENILSAGVIIISNDGKLGIPVDIGKDIKKKFMTLHDFKQSWEQITAKKIVIQCADSIYSEDRSSLVRSSCLEASDYAVKYKDAHPDTDIYILYGTMVNSGTVKKYIEEALSKGIKFYGYYWKEKPEQEETENNVIVTFKDAKSGEKREINADIFIFAQGIVPIHKHNRKIADMLGLKLDADGYFMTREDPLEEINAKFIPNDLGTNGIFITGFGKSPKDIQELLIDADAASQDALYLLPKKKHTPWTGWLIAFTNTRKCAGCGLCVDACAYSARVIDMEKKIAIVREINCQGCGACEAACPSGAAVLRVGNAQQMLEMVDASM